MRGRNGWERSTMSVFLSLFSIFQSFVAVLVLSFKYHRHSKEVTDIGRMQLDFVVKATVAGRVERSMITLAEWMHRLPKCAERNRDSIRSGKVDPSDGEELARQLHSEMVHFDMMWSLMGFSDGRHIGYNRIDLGTNGSDALYTNFFAFDTTRDSFGLLVRNESLHPLLHQRNGSTAQVLRFGIDNEGFPDLDNPAPAYAFPYDPRMRPWFQQTAAVGAATWIKPYVFSETGQLGVDACVPYYQEGQESEELVGVTCCEVTLALLSEQLEQMTLGAWGRTFVVQLEAHGHGLLVAAARTGAVLPVVANDTQIAPTDSDDAVVSHISRLVEREYGGWEGAAKEGVIDADAYLLRVKVLDGSIEDWNIDEKTGQWTRSHYFVQGLTLVLVEVVVVDDFLSVLEDGQAEQGELEQETRNVHILSSFFAIVMFGVVAEWFADKITRSSRKLASRMKSHCALKFTRIHPDIAPRRPWSGLFHIKEIAALEHLLASFDTALRHFKHCLSKKALELVMDIDESEDKAEVRLGGEVAHCTVLCIRLQASGAEDGLEGAAGEIWFFDRCREVIKQHRGVVVSSFGTSVVASWLHDDDRQVQGDAATSACEAALEAVVELDCHEQSKDFDVHCALHSGKAWVGVFGSEQRLKYGVIGTVVDCVEFLSQSDVVQLLGKREQLHRRERSILLTESTLRSSEALMRKARDGEVELYYHDPLDEAFHCHDAVFELVARSAHSNTGEAGDASQGPQSPRQRVIQEQTLVESPISEVKKRFIRSCSFVRTQAQQLAGRANLWASAAPPLGFSRRGESSLSNDLSHHSPHSSFTGLSVSGSACEEEEAEDKEHCEALQFRRIRRITVFLLVAISTCSLALARRDIYSPIFFSFAFSGLLLASVEICFMCKHRRRRPRSHGAEDHHHNHHQPSPPRPRGKAVSMQLVMFTFLVVQMLLSLGVATLIQLPFYSESFNNLKTINLDVGSQITDSFLREIASNALFTVTTFSSPIAKCAHYALIDFHDQRLDENNARIAQSLHTQVLRSKTDWAWVWRADGAYLAVGQQPSGVASQAPQMVFQTNEFNNPEEAARNGIREYTFQGGNGEVNLTSGFLSFDGFEPTQRTWFEKAAENEGLVAIEPYLWMSGDVDVAVGMDVCSALFDTQGEEGEVAREPKVVSCCGTDLAEVSRLLAEVAANSHGTVFVVQVQGAATGAVVAGAIDNRSIDVIQEVEPGSESRYTSVEMQNGRTYGRPLAVHSEPRIALVSRIILETSGSWELVRDGSLSLSKAEVSDRMDSIDEPWTQAAIEDFSGGLDILVSEVPTNLRGWHVNELGQFSETEVAVGGLQWVLVVVLSRQDWNVHGQAVDTVRLVQDEDIWHICILYISMLLASIALSWRFSWARTAPFTELEQKMKQVQEGLVDREKDIPADLFPKDLSFKPVPVVLSVERMQKYTKLLNNRFRAFSRFVPRPVLLNATQRAPLACTIVHCSLVDARAGQALPEPKEIRSWGGFSMASHSEQEQVAGWNRFLANVFSVVKERRGTVIDFSGGEVLFFFDGFDAHGFDAGVAGSVAAAKWAIKEIMDGSLKKEDVPGNLRCTFGVETRECAVGILEGVLASSRRAYSVEVTAGRKARELDALNLSDLTSASTSSRRSIVMLSASTKRWWGDEETEPEAPARPTSVAAQPTVRVHIDEGPKNLLPRRIGTWTKGHQQSSSAALQVSGSEASESAPIAPLGLPPMHPVVPVPAFRSLPLSLENVGEKESPAERTEAQTGTDSPGNEEAVSWQKWKWQRPKAKPKAEPKAEPKDKVNFLVLGSPNEAARGLRAQLGLLNEREFGQLVAEGLVAVEREWEACKDEEAQANFKYVRTGQAGVIADIPRHVKECIKAGRYHGGRLREGDFEKDHYGFRLEDFYQAKESRRAGLSLCEVLALRLYTSSSYGLFNGPLRGRQLPHPFAITVYHLAEGLKKLRAVAARHKKDFATESSLWRGLKNVEVSSDTLEEGGTELAMMSTSAQLEVALKYGLSAQPLILRCSTLGLGRGCSIRYLSLFPLEDEYLYPPLTFLAPRGVMTWEELRAEKSKAGAEAARLHKALLAGSSSAKLEEALRKARVFEVVPQMA